MERSFEEQGLSLSRITSFLEGFQDLFNGGLLIIIGDRHSMLLGVSQCLFNPFGIYEDITYPIGR
jgi:hypothetical protein